MKSLEDLNEYLFEALDRLNACEGDKLGDEIDRAHAVGSVATQIINSTALQMKAKEMLKDKPKALPNYKNSEIICNV